MVIIEDINEFFLNKNYSSFFCRFYFRSSFLSLKQIIDKNENVSEETKQKQLLNDTLNLPLE